MFSIIRLVLRITVALVVLLLVLAFFTNPNLDDFKTEVRGRIKEQLDKMTNDPTLSVIANLGASFSDDMVEKLITRKNYYVCSVYTIELPTGDYEYLGAFHFFYPLQDENPVDKFINTFQSLN